MVRLPSARLSQPSFISPLKRRRDATVSGSRRPPDDVTPTEMFSNFGSKESIAATVCSWIPSKLDLLDVATPLRCVGSNGEDEDEISTGYCRGLDRFDCRLQLILA